MKEIVEKQNAINVAGMEKFKMIKNNPKLSEIILKNKRRVIVDYSSKRKCEICKKEILTAMTKNKKFIKISLIGFAQWDVHKCKKR